MSSGRCRPSRGLPESDPFRPIRRRAPGTIRRDMGSSPSRESASYLVAMRGLVQGREVLVYGCGPDEAAALEDACSKAPTGFAMASLIVSRPGARYLP